MPDPNAKPKTEFQGPPCLQKLSEIGFPEGSEKNGLYNLAVYIRKAFPDKWESLVYSFNKEYTKCEDFDVAEVVKEIRKGDGLCGYKCYEAPIVLHCNRAVCNKRKFGIREPDRMLPVVKNVTMYRCEGTDSVWDVELEGHFDYWTGKPKHLYLNADMLLAQCGGKGWFMLAINNTSLLWAWPTAKEWDAWVAFLTQKALDNGIVDLPFEQTAAGEFGIMLKDWVNKQHTEFREDIRIGKPYLDKEHCRAYFRLQDLIRHLSAHVRWGQMTGGRWKKNGWSEASVLAELQTRFKATSGRIRTGHDQPRCQIISFGELDIPCPPEAEDQPENATI